MIRSRKWPYEGPRAGVADVASGDKIISIDLQQRLVGVCSYLPTYLGLAAYEPVLGGLGQRGRRGM